MRVSAPLGAGLRRTPRAFCEFPPIAGKPDFPARPYPPRVRIYDNLSAFGVRKARRAIVRDIDGALYFGSAPGDKEFRA